MWTPRETYIDLIYMRSRKQKKDKISRVNWEHGDLGGVLGGAEMQGREQRKNVELNKLKKRVVAHAFNPSTREAEAGGSL